MATELERIAALEKLAEKMADELFGTHTIGNISFGTLRKRVTEQISMLQPQDGDNYGINETIPVTISSSAAGDVHVVTLYKILGDLSLQSHDACQFVTKMISGLGGCKSISARDAGTYLLKTKYNNIEYPGSTITVSARPARFPDHHDNEAKKLP